MEMVPLLLLGPVLLAAGYCDLRYMKIPNILPIASIGLFVLLMWFFVPLDSALRRVALAALFLVLGFVAFALRTVGGGDVKMLAALQLFVPPATISLFMLEFAAALLAGIALVHALRIAPLGSKAGWKALQPGANFPMGVSIAMAGLAHPVALAALSG
jgi:prepilin peptidase CpaA